MPKRREGGKRRILDWEALEEAPNTHGAFSFLKSAAEIVSIRRDDVLIESGKRAKEPRPADAAPAPRFCRLVQDAHSLGESVLYQVLWSRGLPETEADETRLVSLGWRTMARYCTLNDKGCKRNTAGLISKLAIDVICAENIHNRKGRTYRVFSFGEILKRRRAAGFEWVSRDKSRRFVQKDGLSFPDGGLRKEGTALSYSDTVVIADTVVDFSASHLATVSATTIGAVVAKTPGTVVATTPPLGSSLGIQEEEKPSSSTEVNMIVQALALQAGMADASAAIRLIRECRKTCPSATTDEIAAVVREKGFAARYRRDVRNMVGFLLATVPIVFDGEGIEIYRRRVTAEMQAAVQAEDERRRNAAEMTAYFTKLKKQLCEQLDDPGLSEKKRGELQKRVLELEGVLAIQDEG
jgi:hypothetical protein